MTILKELTVVTGQYTDRTGATKKRYKTIGHLHSGQYGDYITLNADVNLAAYPRKDGDDRVTCNLREPYQKDKPAAGKPAQAQDMPDDDIPFN